MPLAGVLLTMVTVAAIAGIAIPGFFGRHEVTLDNAVVLVARELRAAQDRSIYLGVPSVVLFDDDGLQVVDANGRPVTRVGSQLPFERRFSTDGVFEGVRVEAIDFDGGRSLRYDEQGHAGTAGEVWVSFQGEQRVLRVQSPSGAIRIEGLARRWFDREL